MDTQSLENEAKLMASEDASRQEEEAVERYWRNARKARGWEQEMHIAVYDHLDQQLRKRVEVRIIKIRNLPNMGANVHSVKAIVQLEEHSCCAEIPVGAGGTVCVGEDNCFSFGGDRQQLPTNYVLRFEVLAVKEDAEEFSVGSRTVLGKRIARHDSKATWLALECSTVFGKEHRTGLSEILKEAPQWNSSQTSYFSQLVQKEEMACVEEDVSQNSWLKYTMEMGLVPKSRGFRSFVQRRLNPEFEVLYCNRKVYHGVMKTAGVSFDFTAHEAGEMLGDEDLQVIIYWRKSPPSRVCVFGTDKFWQKSHKKVVPLPITNLVMSVKPIGRYQADMHGKVSIRSLCFTDATYHFDVKSRTTTFERNGVVRQMEASPCGNRSTRVLQRKTVAPVKPKRKRKTFVKLWCQRNERSYYLNVEDETEWYWKIPSVGSAIVMEPAALPYKSKVLLCLRIQRAIRIWMAKRICYAARLRKYDEVDIDWQVRRWKMEDLECSTNLPAESKDMRWAAKMLVLAMMIYEEGDLERASVCCIQAFNSRPLKTKEVVKHAFGKGKLQEISLKLAGMLKDTWLLHTVSPATKEALVFYNFPTTCLKLLDLVGSKAQLIEAMELSRELLVGMGASQGAQEVSNDCTEFCMVQLHRGNMLGDNRRALFESKCCDYFLHMKVEAYDSALTGLLEVFRFYHEGYVGSSGLFSTVEVCLHFNLVLLYQYLERENSEVKLALARAYEAYSAHLTADVSLLQEDMEQWFHDARVWRWLLVQLLQDRSREGSCLAINLLVENVYYYGATVANVDSLMSVLDYEEVGVTLLHTGSSWLLEPLLIAMNSEDFRVAMEFDKVCQMKDIFETRTSTGRTLYLARLQTCRCSRLYSKSRRRTLGNSLKQLHYAVIQQRNVKRHYAKHVKATLLGPSFRAWRCFTSTSLEEKQMAASMFQGSFRRYRTRKLVRLAHARRVKALELHKKAAARMVHRRNREIICSWRLLVDRRKALDMLHTKSARKCADYFATWRGFVLKELERRDAAAKKIQTSYLRFCHRQRHQTYVKTLRRQKNLEVCKAVLLQGIEQNAAAHRLQGFIRRTTFKSKSLHASLHREEGLSWENYIHIADLAATMIEAAVRMWQTRSLFCLFRRKVTKIQALFRGRHVRCNLRGVLIRNVRQGTVDWILQKRVARKKAQRRRSDPTQRKTFTARRTKRPKRMDKVMFSGAPALQANYVLPSKHTHRSSQKLSKKRDETRAEDFQIGCRQVIRLPPLQT